MLTLIQHGLTASNLKISFMDMATSDSDDKLRIVE